MQELMTAPSHPISPAEVISAAGVGSNASIRRFGIVVRVSGESTAGAVAVLEHTLPPGTLSMPRHRHAATEVITMTGGELHLELNGVVQALRAGDVAAIPSGAPHTFWVDPDAEAAAKFLAVVAPAGLDRYYADISAAIPPGNLPAMDAIHAAGERHGVEVEMESLYELIGRHTVQLS
jgi:quercetin dioxygenase-like cupin family protein